MSMALNIGGIAVLAISGTVVAVAGAVFYVTRQMSRRPDNTPERFVMNGDRAALPPGCRVVACLGASIVQGRVGSSFVDLLSGRFRDPAVENCYVFLNAGINGDTSYHALQRLQPVVACDPDLVVVLLGNNDAICTLNPDSWRMYKAEKALPRQPSLEWYRDNMRAIVRTLKESTRARIGLCSLPVLGEDLSALPNERVREFNAVIKQIAEEEGASYLPVYEAEEAFLREQQAAGARRYPRGRSFNGTSTESLGLGFVANLEHYLLGRSYDAVSRRNGMLLKTDLVHGNSREAAIIADHVEAFLNAQA